MRRMSPIIMAFRRLVMRVRDDWSVGALAVRGCGPIRDALAAQGREAAGR